LRVCEYSESVLSLVIIAANRSTFQHLQSANGICLVWDNSRSVRSWKTKATSEATHRIEVCHQPILQTPILNDDCHIAGHGTSNLSRNPVDEILDQADPSDAATGGLADRCHWLQIELNRISYRLVEARSNLV
jgi:hypothetical protein